VQKPTSQAPWEASQVPRVGAVACHDLASLRVTGERNLRLLAAGPPDWLRVQGREGALSAPGAGAGLCAGSGAAEVAVGGGVALAAESAR
jgi:hypothetical protein